MQPRICTMGAMSLSAAICLGSAAMAADLPKEGTWNTTYSGFATYKTVSVGKDWTANASDENATTVGDGLLDHMTWHCWGLYDVVHGMAQFHGSCVATDPAGDQLAGDYASDGRYAPDSTHITGTFTIRAGTGKYTGITGSGTFVPDPSPLRAATEGTYFPRNTNHGSYKLP